MPEITITPSDYISRIGRQAREASRSMARASTAAKNAVLERIAELLLEQEADIRAANEADLEAACAEGLDEVFLDRLTISAVGLPKDAARSPHSRIPWVLSPILPSGQAAFRWAACACPSACSP